MKVKKFGISCLALLSFSTTSHAVKLNIENNTSASKHIEILANPQQNKTYLVRGDVQKHTTYTKELLANNPKIKEPEFLVWVYSSGIRVCQLSSLKYDQKEITIKIDDVHTKSKCTVVSSN